ncbi:MAG TPA: TIGR03086 family metal-binding protein [Candidatus Dormibacteraeota bacterium]|nr:TIGR03086 family metal-binding protein [Acidimicrobiales bacterium]HLH68202.1 TIGR03086 family metal-binding protein [Candidatus Dormibacteraeota bacterium]
MLVVADSDAIFLGGLDLFSRTVARLGAADWERPSPCAGWRALDVLGHAGSAVQFGTQLLRGGRPAWEPLDPPGTAVEGDPGTWWERIAGAAREAVRGVELSRAVDSPRGPRRVGEALSFPALDLFVHAWDLGRAAGADVEIPPEAIEFAHTVIDPMPAQQVRSPRVFGPEVMPPPGATPTQRFIAWTGRDPLWSKASKEES